MKHIAHTSPDSHHETMGEHIARIKSITDNQRYYKPAKYLLAVTHDLGKILPDWQNAVKTGSKPPPHSEFGAHLTHNWLRQMGASPNVARMMADIVAGHHGSIGKYVPDMPMDVSGIAEYARQISNMHKPITDSMTHLAKLDHTDFGVAYRMIYADICNADILATQQYYGTVPTKRNYPTPRQMMDMYDKYMTDLKNDDEKKQSSEMSAGRNLLYDICTRFDGTDDRNFLLDAPTGMGKTLASLRAALGRLIKNDRRRIIVAIPYCSIVAQTADVYRKIFGAENILEHHSGTDVLPDAQDRIWDAPIIITTNVQLMSTLWGTRKKQLRKMSHIIDSVIIVDECQIVRNGVVRHMTDTLLSLGKYCDVIMTTATMPPYNDIKSWRKKGWVQMTTEDEYHQMLAYSDRADVLFANPDDRPISISNLVDMTGRYANKSQMVISNTRKQCRLVYDMMCDKYGRDNVYQYGAHMMPDHRTRVMATIVSRLKAGEKIFISATRAIEAGVDISMDIVWRDACGIDSIAQAAGRCNRHGAGERGKVFIFFADQPPAVLGDLLQGFRVAGENGMWKMGNRILDSRSAESSEFWQKYLAQDIANPTNYLSASGKGYDVIRESEENQLIDNDQTAVLVRTPEAMDIYNRMEAAYVTNNKYVYQLLVRKLQRFMINMYEPEKYPTETLKFGGVDEDGDDVIFVTISEDTYYDEIVGEEKPTT